MIAHITFQRSLECPHDQRRECTACFKTAMISFFHSQEEFEAAWKNRSGGEETPEDFVESFSVYL